MNDNVNDSNDSSTSSTSSSSDLNMSSNGGAMGT